MPSLAALLASATSLLPAGKRRPVRESWQRWADALFRVLCQGAALLVLALFVALVAILVVQSWPAITTIGLGFVRSKTWDPEPSHRQFGALAFVWGTVSTSAIALALAVPLGVGTATYLAEVAPRRLRQVGAYLLEMLAAIPSVVYGFWGLFVLVPALQKVYTALGSSSQSGQGILAAGIVLSIMILPYVAAVSFEVLRAVARVQREAALALGATRWQAIRTVVFPQARVGIVGACFLALGRALGETMAVTMLIGNRPDVDASPFALGNTIASVIVNELIEAGYDLYLSALVELGLVLLLVSVAVSALARLLIWQVGKSSRQASPAGEAPPSTPPSAAPLPFPAEDLPLPAADSGKLPNNRTAQWLDRAMTAMLGLCFAVTVSFLVLILGYLVYRGSEGLSWQLFVRMPAPVGRSGGGMANAMAGSLMMVGLATLGAAPVGLFAAVYLAEYRSRWLAATVRFVSELLAGVPSIVVGIFGYTILVRPMGTFSGWAGAFALAVLMLPVILHASEQALRMVPDSLRQASYALGASQRQAVLKVVLPAALPGVLTAVFLSVARVSGETAPLLLTASSNWFWPSSPGDFTPSLPVYIFSYALSPYEDWHRQAWAAALVLVAFVMLLSFGVRLLSGKRLVQVRQVE